MAEIGLLDYWINRAPEQKCEGLAWEHTLIRVIVGSAKEGNALTQRVRLGWRIRTVTAQESHTFDVTDHVTAFASIGGRRRGCTLTSELDLTAAFQHRYDQG